jgi:hypothetical protein
MYAPVYTPSNRVLCSTHVTHNYCCIGHHPIRRRREQGLWWRWRWRRNCLHTLLTLTRALEEREVGIKDVVKAALSKAVVTDTIVMQVYIIYNKSTVLYSYNGSFPSGSP